MYESAAAWWHSSTTTRPTSLMPAPGRADQGLHAGADHVVTGLVAFGLDDADPQAGREPADGAGVLLDQLDAVGDDQRPSAGLLEVPPHDAGDDGGLTPAGRHHDGRTLRVGAQGGLYGLHLIVAQRQPRSAHAAHRIT